MFSKDEQLEELQTFCDKLEMGLIPRSHWEDACPDVRVTITDFSTRDEVAADVQRVMAEIRTQED